MKPRTKEKIVVPIIIHEIREIVCTRFVGGMEPELHFSFFLLFFSQSIHAHNFVNRKFIL